MPLVGAGLGIEDDDAAVAVAVGDVDLVGRRIDLDIRRAAEPVGVVAAAGLALLADLQQELAVAGEFQQECRRWRRCRRSRHCPCGRHGCRARSPARRGGPGPPQACTTLPSSSNSMTEGAGMQHSRTAAASAPRRARPPSWCAGGGSSRHGRAHRPRRRPPGRCPSDWAAASARRDRPGRSAPAPRRAARRPAAGRAREGRDAWDFLRIFPKRSACSRAAASSYWGTIPALRAASPHFFISLSVKAPRRARRTCDPCAAPPGRTPPPPP